MTKPTFVIRGFGNYDVDEVSFMCGVSIPSEDGVTQQQFKDECDINVIVKRFGLTGELPDNFAMPVSGDFTGVNDFHSAMNVVRESQEAFMSLPGEMRARFGHDPGALLAFLGDVKNRDEAVKLGLVSLPPEKPRDVVQAVDELASKLIPPKQ